MEKPISRGSLFWYGMTMLTLFFMSADVSAQNKDGDKHYHTPSEINNKLEEIRKSSKKSTKIHTLATSPGGRSVQMIEIGPEVDNEKKQLPAIFVAANLEGTIPISSEAAIHLAELVISEQAAQDKTWYIVPNGNPDAAAHYFKNPLLKDSRNDLSHNDDMDENTDEDGFEDLNEDGFITKMRVKDPTGEWRPVEGDSRLMKKADPTKGEKGIYKLYTEGIDDDGDGKYNEDGKGGVNVNRNFPHLFKDFTETGGAWPGSTPEVYAIFDFVYSHPEIAMTFSYGATNFSKVAPKGGRKSSADFENLKIPESFADQLGADPDKTYTMDEVIRMVEPLAPAGFEVTESVVASFLGLGAVVNPQSEDLKFYNELADQYKEYLKEKGLDAERLGPEAAKDASFELWSYYHLGIPTFSMDFWRLPKPKKEKKDEEGSGLTADKIEKMSSEEFVALGEEKIGMFLEEIGAPDQFTAKRVIGMIEGGQMTPKRMGTMIKKMGNAKGSDSSSDGASEKDKALMAFNDNVLDGSGFVEWESYNHPTLGEVEIGGEVPFVRNTPPGNMVDSLLKAQVPWTITLSEKIAKLQILNHEVQSKGSNVFKITVWVENENYLPFPTAMGKKNKQPRPAILSLQAKGLKVLDGKQRTPINSIGGHEVKKYSWLVRSPESNTIDVNLESTHAWNDRTQVNLGGSK
ncbi:M14 family metallopeptidase [Fodinibius halophilus]|uniref:Peptidase M14 domain-containing protein n=1 Tax=Fodinibius halophilus TaxID=1736908 RepID=A0A6M1TCW5_9BACT|nr:M14 family metallopeptidase [Fodinibius halophilus]NGP88704.1 hypothetical protein [Fodinibius halophilus]